MGAAMVIEAGSEASFVMRGFEPRHLHRQAARECERRLGAGWRFTEEQIRPCMVSAGGHVRLYEGRFRATRA